MMRSNSSPPVTLRAAGTRLIQASRPPLTTQRQPQPPAPPPTAPACPCPPHSSMAR